MFSYYLSVLNELKRMGTRESPRKVCSGILAKRLAGAQRTDTRQFLSRLPDRDRCPLDVHFWWNMGEFTLLLLASVTYLRKIIPVRTPVPIKLCNFKQVSNSCLRLLSLVQAAPSLPKTYWATF
jgi:hypothetical protein